MDQFDRAQELEQRDRDDALARQALKRTKGESAKWCEAPHCGQRIPDARRKAVPGVRYCIECQGCMEKYGKSFARESA